MLTRRALLARLTTAGLVAAADPAEVARRFWRLDRTMLAPSVPGAFQIRS